MSRSHKSTLQRGVPTHKPSKIARWDSDECWSPEGKRKLKAVRRKSERRENKARLQDAL
jgi:hypothetical protein